MAAPKLISRRRFLALGAGAAIGALAHRNAHGANGRIRLGLLGCGPDAVDLVSALRYSGARFDLAYVWDDAAPLRDAMAARTQSLGLENWQDLVERPDVDGVMVATRASSHSTMAVTAMDTGKDVYCVSPMTETLSDSSSFREAADRSGRVVQIGAWRTSDPAWRSAMEVYRSGGIGSAKRTTVSYSEGRGSVQTLQRVYDAIAPVVMATGAGYPENVTAAGGRHDGDLRGMPDMLMLCANYSGAHSVIAASSADSHSRATLRGTRGHIELREHGGSIMNRGEAQLLLLEDEGQCRVRHVSNWLESVVTRQSPVCDAELGHRAMVATGMALEAYYSSDGISRFASIDVPSIHHS